MSWVNTSLDWLGRRLAGRHGSDYCPADGTEVQQTNLERLARTLRPADVLLVEGCDRISAAVKYLTQSTWSHAALYVGDALGPPSDGGEPFTLVEVNVGEGCVASRLSKYRYVHTRICRPVHLTPADRHRIVTFMINRIGTQYDMRNVVDLARYLLPTPPVPARFRRRMIALGSGEPTRAICSTLIAQAFKEVRYPILPRVERLTKIEANEDRGPSDHPLQEAGQERTSAPSMGGYSPDEILHIRNHSLFAPRDFDVSPYFQIVKPTIEDGFNYKGVVWADEPGDIGGSFRSRRE